MSAPVELLQAAHKQRLLAIVTAVPGWVAEEILKTSEHIGEDGAAVFEEIEHVLHSEED